MFVDTKVLLEPLKWKPMLTPVGQGGSIQEVRPRPRRIFVENQSDLFGKWVTDEMLDRVFAVMALCPQHVFQVLTKRPEQMLRYFEADYPRPLDRREISGSSVRRRRPAFIFRSR